MFDTYSSPNYFHVLTTMNYPSNIFQGKYYASSSVLSKVKTIVRCINNIPFAGSQPTRSSDCVCVSGVKAL